jgi:hypothetical protein
MFLHFSIFCRRKKCCHFTHNNEREGISFDVSGGLRDSNSRELGELCELGELGVRATKRIQMSASCRFGEDKGKPCGDIGMLGMSRFNTATKSEIRL